jgi:hypothetical protein
MSDFDKIIFKNKKFSDLLSEIYDNQKRKQDQISVLISELKPLIQDIGDATLIVPLIKEYLDLGIKNDEQLIKIATIIQRVVKSNETSGGGELISEEEKAQLMKEINKLKDNE